MSTRHDDEEFERLRQWLSTRAAGREEREPRDIRWLVYYIIGLCAIAALLIAVGAEAATVTVDTIGYQLNLGSNNKISLSRVASVPLGKPCTAMTVTDPLRTVQLIQDRLLATMDPNPKRPGQFFTRPRQVWAKCGTAQPPPPPPPVASLEVYTCADAGADGRILESATISWPNCQSVSYQNPSRSLVVATNDDGVLLWRDALKVTTGRVGTRDETGWVWTPVGDIDWGAPPPATGTANLRWTKPMTNVDGTMLTTLSGYRIYYGPSPTLLAVTVEINNPSTLAYTVQNLTAGTWHFAIKSLTPTQESALSNTVAVTLP